MKTQDILRQGADTFEKKTADYGDSWRKIGTLLWELNHGEPVVLDSPEKMVAFGLFTRRFDKIAREFNGTFGNDLLNFEATEDSAMDESVYAAMAAENLSDMHAAEGYRNVSADGGEPETRRFVNVNAELDELDELLDELEAEIEAEAADSDVEEAIGEVPDLGGNESGWHATREDVQGVFERGSEEL